MVTIDDLNIVIDTGPDFRQQMLREKIEKIDAVLYTHSHKDHVAGLDDVRAFNFKHNMDMPLYATKDVISQLKKEFEYAFLEKKYPGAPRLITTMIDGDKFMINKTEIIPIVVKHYIIPVMGYRFRDFTYITDVSYISASEKVKIKGSKILVIDALQKEPHLSHFTLSQALELIKEIQPEQAYLIHLSHRMGKHEDVEKELPSNVKIAYDGLKIKC